VGKKLERKDATRSRDSFKKRQRRAEKKFVVEA
jgi:hypothetical protein